MGGLHRPTKLVCGRSPCRKLGSREVGKYGLKRNEDAMNRREIVLEQIKVAGYKNDQRTAIRLYAENRVSYSAYMQAWRKGVELKNREAKKEQNDER